MQPPTGPTSLGNPLGFALSGVFIIFMICGVMPGGICIGAGFADDAGIADDIGIGIDDWADAVEGAQNTRPRTTAGNARRALMEILSRDIKHVALDPDQS